MAGGRPSRSKIWCPLERQRLIAVSCSMISPDHRNSDDQPTCLAFISFTAASKAAIADSRLARSTNTVPLRDTEVKISNCTHKSEETTFMGHLLYQPRIGIYFKLRLAVTLQYFGKICPMTDQSGERHLEEPRPGRLTLPKIIRSSSL